MEIMFNHGRTGNFLPRGAVNHLPKKFSQVAQIFTKESSYDTLKEIAVSAISTANYINNTIHVFLDYRVGIFPFTVNKCDVTNALLSHRAAEVSFQSAQPTE